MVIRATELRFVDKTFLKFSLKPKASKELEGWKTSFCNWLSTLKSNFLASLSQISFAASVRWGLTDYSVQAD